VRGDLWSVGLIVRRLWRRRVGTGWQWRGGLALVVPGRRLRRRCRRGRLMWRRGLVLGVCPIGTRFRRLMTRLILLGRWCRMVGFRLQASLCFGARWQRSRVSFGRVVRRCWLCGRTSTGCDGRRCALGSSHAARWLIGWPRNSLRLMRRCGGVPLGSMVSATRERALWRSGRAVLRSGRSVFELVGVV
jgi:hypothetical protein